MAIGKCIYKATRQFPFKSVAYLPDNANNFKIIVADYP